MDDDLIRSDRAGRPRGRRWPDATTAPARLRALRHVRHAPHRPRAERPDGQGEVRADPARPRGARRRAPRGSSVRARPCWRRRCSRTGLAAGGAARARGDDAAQRLLRPDPRALPRLRRGLRQALGGRGPRGGRDQDLARRLGRPGARGDRRPRGAGGDAGARQRRRRDRRPRPARSRPTGRPSCRTTPRPTPRRSSSWSAPATRRASTTGATW